MDKDLGLNLKSLRTACEIYKISFDCFEDLESTLTEKIKDGAMIVAYLSYKVMVGTLTGGRMKFYQDEQFEIKYLQKLRAFDLDKEILLWHRKGTAFAMRLRIDGTGKEQDVVEVCQVLWGTKAKAEDGGWIRLTEDRGVKLILPLKERIVDANTNRVKIKTRNYIDYNETGQAGYMDCRFVEFV